MAKKSVEPCPTCGRHWRPGQPGKTPLARALYEKRLKSRMSLREAAEDAGTSWTTYWRAERGRTPDVQTAILLSRWVKQPLDVLFMTAQDHRARSGR